LRRLGSNGVAPKEKELKSSPALRARADRHVPGGAQLFLRIFTRLGCHGRPPQFVVEFHPYADLTHTIRIRQEIAYVRLSDILRDAELHVFESAAAILLSRMYRRKTPREFLDAYREFTYSRETRARLTNLRRTRSRRIPELPAGKIYDLSPLFDQLNREYFEDALPRPRLGWSRKPWRRTLGHFDPALNQIVLSKDLDREKVPQYVVEYVLFHEMLHVKHPIKFARCRLTSHSKNFREEEKRYKNYARAQTFLRRLS
jgi:SprT-like family